MDYKLSNFLISVGFIQSKFECFLFTKGIDKNFIIIFIYVDDIIIT